MTISTIAIAAARSTVMDDNPFGLDWPPKFELVGRIDELERQDNGFGRVDMRGDWPGRQCTFGC